MLCYEIHRGLEHDIRLAIAGQNNSCRQTSLQESKISQVGSQVAELG